MPEMGVSGMVEVLAIEPCPDIQPGPGRLVTGTFQHMSGEIYDLKLESESKPIGVTDLHPIWSMDRNAWVPVVDLEIGETLKTLAGTSVVESRCKRKEPETVYNIEVEGDHVYRVGETGVLVHNNSVESAVQRAIEDVLSSHPTPNRSCFDCCDAACNAIKCDKKTGKKLILTISLGGTGQRGNIFADSGRFAGGLIADNGKHCAVEYDGTLYDSNWPGGVSRTQWMKDLRTINGGVGELLDRDIATLVEESC